jgi:hypothetical protein
MNIEPELAVINRVDFDGPSKEPPMSFFRGSLLISAIAVGLSAPAFAQPKADAGSGPTKGAISTDDAGSWPTKGAKPNADKTAAESMDTTENSAGVTPGPKSTGGAQPATPITPEKKQ